MMMMITRACTKAGVSINTIYATRIMPDFTVTEPPDSLSHETKYLLILTGFLCAKGHSTHPRALFLNFSTTYTMFRFMQNSPLIQGLLVMWAREFLSALSWPEVNNLVDDVHRGRNGAFLD
jgi:hypothetical protein